MDAKAVERLENVVANGRDVLSTGEGIDETQSQHEYVNWGQFRAWQAQALTCLGSMNLDDTLYRGTFTDTVQDNTVADVEAGIEILSRLKEDIQDGYLTSIRVLIHESVFSDLLEQAEYFASDAHGFKVPAAVIAGSVLEEHLRKLCDRHTISTRRPDGKGPKSAGTLNTDLASKKAISANDAKMVTSLLGVRNFAAHAKHDEYELPEVKLMVQSIRMLISKYLA